MEVKYREEQVITSPYVTQADKMAVSLRHLADRFLKMEPKKQCFTPEEMTEMYDRITEKKNTPSVFWFSQTLVQRKILY